MGDTFKYWEQNEFPAEKPKKEITENLKNLLDYYNLLSVEEKVEAKSLIREQKSF